MNKVVLKCDNVSKSYKDGQLNVNVLNQLRLEVLEGQSVSIIGSSGSGKSTLMHILGGLDKPTSGSVVLMGQDLSQLGQKQLGLLRNQYLGFVYQFHHLLPEFSALENVMMPLLIGKMKKAEAEKQTAKADNAKAEAKTAEGGKKVILQMGSYADRNSADAQRAKLAMLGISSKVVERTNGDKTVYRVQSNSMSSEAAKNVQKDLQKHNINSLMRSAQ